MFTTSPSIVAFAKEAATFLEEYYDDNNLNSLSLEGVELPAWIFKNGDVNMYNTMSHITPICIIPDPKIVNSFGLFSLYLMPRHWMDDFDNYTIEFMAGIRATLAHLKVGDTVSDLEIMTIFNDPVDPKTGEISALVVDVTSRLR